MSRLRIDDDAYVAAMDRIRGLPPEQRQDALVAFWESQDSAWRRSRMPGLDVLLVFAFMVVMVLGAVSR